MIVELAEIARYMRMGRTVPAGLLAERVEKLRCEGLASMRQMRTWRRFPVVDNSVGVAGRRLEISGKLARHMMGCHAAYLACATLGAGFDAFQRRQAAASGAAGLIVQAIGAAAIEQWMDATEDVLRNELASGETLVPRYSPGYGDFPLAAQQPLLALLDAPLKAGVSLTAASLMVPTKSVSAIIGVKRHTR